MLQHKTINKLGLHKIKKPTIGSFWLVLEYRNGKKVFHYFDSPNEREDFLKLKQIKNVLQTFS